MGPDEITGIGDAEADTRLRYLKRPQQFPAVPADRPSPRRSLPPVSTTAVAPRRRLTSDETLALWQEYRATGDKRTRDRLVLTFAPLVKYIVYKKVREMPARCEVEDFISCGLEALIQSIDRYDPDKGATLEQYAWTRIHGAVLDELRRQDWAPRSIRRWERDHDKAIEEFTALHRRRPTRTELAEALGTTVTELRRRQEEIQRSDLTSLNTLVLSDDETTIERIDTLASTDAASTPSTRPRPPRPRTSSARCSPSSRSASARSPSCSTSRTSRSPRSGRSSACRRAASARSTAR
jgi:RNA polymerase sigma factor for flagellar operon FliA